MDKIRSRTLAVKIVKPTAKEEEQKKAVRDNSPSPHTYKHEESIEKTKKSILRYSFPKGKPESFIDQALKKVTGKNPHP